MTMRIRTRLLACAALLSLTNLSGVQAMQQDGDDVVAASSQARKRAPHVLDPAESGIGRTVTPLAWRDLRGRRGQLGRVGAKRGLVVALTDTTCPLTQKYGPSLKRTAAECVERGLEFVLLNTSEGEGREELAAWIAEHEFAAPYIHDPSGELARELGAVTTTDCFLLDREGRLVYRGALDDQYGLGYTLDAPRERYLHDAIDALLEGRTPAVQATWAPGCVLGLEPREALEAHTWHGRISRIVRTNCSGCHHTGGVAPFPLVTREDVVRKKGMVGFVLEERIMPPWTATDGSGPWSNDCSISDGDREALVAWLEAGLPAGDQATALVPRVQSPDEWEIGTPDRIIELPHEIAVQAEGVMDYVHVSIDPGFAEDRWVRAVEIRPTDRSVVHHVVVYVEEPEGGKRHRLNGLDDSTGFLAAYVPGNAFNVLPPGFARKLRAGTKLLFQMHYTPNGVATVDRPRLGLLFADGPPEHEVKSFGIVEQEFKIPPGAGHHEVKKHIKLPRGIAVLSLMPHMHLRGQSVRIDAHRPGESPVNLLNVPVYDFNWQFAYRFVEPVMLPKGSYVQVQAWFDNSAGNPANPDPTMAVRWGEQTTDEMMIGYLEYYEL